jgi:hypothetical protein
MAARIDRWRGRRREKSIVERAPLGEELGGEGATRKDREQATAVERDLGQATTAVGRDRGQG